MTQNSAIKIAFWRGVLIAPLAVLPATLIWALIAVVNQFTVQNLIDAIFNVIFISLWGICVAYVITATYGSLVWYALWRYNVLSLGSLLLAVVIPCAITAIITTDILFSLMVTYYSLAVVFSFWFVGIRNIKE
jgi:hypothetical protein